MQREYVRVLQVRGDLDLVQEPLRADDRGELGPEHLERDRAIVFEVAREVDGRHAALTEVPLDAVAVGERGGELGCEVLHGGQAYARGAFREGWLPGGEGAGVMLTARSGGYPRIGSRSGGGPPHRGDACPFGPRTRS